MGILPQVVGFGLFRMATPSSEQHPEYDFQSTGTFNVCLLITDSRGCTKEICQDVEIDVNNTPLCDCPPNHNNCIIIDQTNNSITQLIANMDIPAGGIGIFDPSYRFEVQAGVEFDWDIGYTFTGCLFEFDDGASVRTSATGGHYQVNGNTFRSCNDNEWVGIIHDRGTIDF